MSDGSDFSDSIISDEEEEEEEYEESYDEEDDGVLDADSDSLLGEELCWTQEPTAAQKGNRPWTPVELDDLRRARWLRHVQHWKAQTHVSHNQCSDALASLGGSQLCLGKRRSVSLFDTERGVSVCDSPTLPFDIYGLDADPTTGWVAAGGAERTSAHHHVALLRLARDGDATTWVVAHTFTCGEAHPATGASEQVNSVRFAAVRQAAAGGERASAMLPVLIVGSQDSHVYVYPLPPVPSASASGPDARPLRPLRVHTFPVAINCACASPDGRLLAAAGDREEVYLLGGDAGFVDVNEEGAEVPHHTMQIMAEDPTPQFEPAGCQYLAWSADSRLLAASSDTVDGVAVWAVHPDCPSRLPEGVARILRHDTDLIGVTVLALSFVGASHVLAWAERTNMVHAVDVDHLQALDRSCWEAPLYRGVGHDYLRTLGLQRLYLVPPEAPSEPLMWQPSGEPDRITGLCACGPDLLVSLPHAVFRLQAVTEWSRELHPQFPVSFRQAARTLLLCANQQPPLSGQPPTLASVPPEVLTRIIALAAVPPSSWLRSTRASAEEEEDMRDDNEEIGFDDEEEFGEDLEFDAIMGEALGDEMLDDDGSDED